MSLHGARVAALLAWVSSLSSAGAHCIGGMCCWQHQGTMLGLVTGGIVAGACPRVAQFLLFPGRWVFAGETLLTVPVE